MKKYTLFVPSFFLIWILFLSAIIIGQENQSSIKNDEQFKNAQKEFVNENLIKLGKNAIERERFLIQQMRMLNEEIKLRVTNVEQVRKKYFDGLEERLQELTALKNRLNISSSSSLAIYLSELENKIKQTINEGRIDFRRQKVFEDGLQLLYIAEEMINLDPSSKLEENPKIAQELQSSRQKFLNTFGESQTMQTESSTSKTEKEASIFNLFKEWKNTNTVKYEARWTDILIIKNKLIKIGTAAEKDRMFKRELEYAVMSYNYNKFDLADRLFGEIIKRYDFLSTLDDLYFYKGESNFNMHRYFAAQTAYKILVEEYPTSGFTASAYFKLLKIAAHFGDGQKVENYLKGFEKIASSNDPLYPEARFTAALSAVNANEFEKAVGLLNQIDSNSEFYIDGQYLLGQAFVGSQNLDEAERVWLSLIQNYTVSPDYRFNILLKLGYLKYEKGEYNLAINYFDQISINFVLYDKTLIGYGWTYYKLELQKPQHEEKDFTLAKKYLSVLTEQYITSDYYLEAKSLLGYIYQLEQDPNKATQEYDYAFQSRYTKRYSDEMINERDSLKVRISQLESLSKKALSENNQQAYLRAKNLQSELDESYMRVSYSDISPDGIAARNEVKRVQEQLVELDRLQSKAEEVKDEQLINKIVTLKKRLTNVLHNFPIEQTISQLGINYFDEHPSARKESAIEDQNKKIIALRKSSAAERLKMTEQIMDLEADIAKAKASKNYRMLAKLELKKQKFEDLKKRFDYLETYAFNMGLKESQINLQKWSDYGAFGIANVNFAVKKYKSDRVSYFIEQVQKINQILNSRKSILEHKINLIEGEINLMTRNVRKQERLREREELNRRFEETYFDTHTTEFEESNTTPPEIEEEP